MPILQSTSCEHYIRQCISFFTCCNKSYSCRRCHDMEEDHKSCPLDITKITCSLCSHVQPVSNECASCKIPFGTYFCSECKLWDITNDEIFHCFECKCCKRSDPLETIHCYKCNTCMSKNGLGRHKHIENAVHGNCPICSDDMAECYTKIVLLNCGHSLHEACFNGLIGESYLCPLCLRSTGDTEVLNEKISELTLLDISQTAERRGSFDLKCHDCSSITKIGAKGYFNRCVQCFSYNTAVIKENKDT